MSLSEELAATALDSARRLVSDVLQPLKQAFVGKDEVIDLLGVSLVGGEHLFILGPPGTAKSAIVRELARRIEGRVFDYLLTRFTEPNELFGPFDIRKLREGELVTNTEGMLPEASFVFLDELLNANSAILNSLLMVLNERVFRRGRETRKLPLLMVVGASNRLPEDESLGALFDRFLLRVRCDNVSQELLPNVLDAGWRLELAETAVETLLNVDDVRRIQRLLSQVDLAAIRAAYVDLIHRLKHAGIEISDRRAVKLQRLIAASAVLCGRLHSEISDLWVLRYIWEKEEQQEVLRSIVQDTIERAKPEESSRHPRSRKSEIPDPERLAADLDRIAERLQQPDLQATERTCLQDQTSLLAARVEWVAEEQARGFLKTKLEAVWKQLQDAPRQ